MPLVVKGWWALTLIWGTGLGAWGLGVTPQTLNLGDSHSNSGDASGGGMNLLVLTGLGLKMILDIHDPNPFIIHIKP